MYLKSLDISGFKSFADKTHIEFHQGVTAIVGPNGCGKSNVLDSIRWALGEQSAKALRGGQMQDVIFGGTDSRKPLAMAEVTMTFADCEAALGTDFHEVQITRRVFRDGNGEYEINKRPCRLKDIHQLFMDTGIGRSAYSIMEQGKIDLILSSKPDDRRAVFEEAAGITKFKSQRKEALRKLEATEANLIRVSDIIKEVRRQLGSLQRQAAKARRYREIFDRLRLLDTNLARLEFQDLRSRLATGEATVRQLQLEFGEVETTVETRESEVRQARIDLENCDLALQALEQKKNRALNVIEQSDAQTVYHRQRIAEMEVLIERNRLEKAASEEKLKSLEEQLTGVRGEQAGLDEKENQARAAVQSAHQALDAAKAEIAGALRERSEIDRVLTHVTGEINATQGRLAAIEMQRKTCLGRVEEIHAEEASGKAHAAELEQSLQLLAERIREASTALETLQGNREAEAAKLEGLRLEWNEARKALQDAESEVGRLSARRDALRRLIQSRTGFSNGTRKLLEAFQGRGVAGPLIDFVTARAGYEDAVELCLGAAWEALVVDDAGAVAAMLANLEQSGSATLVPPDAWNRGGQADAFRAESALNFIEARPPVTAWLRNLLRHHYIAESAVAAETIRREIPEAIVVTPQGEIWHADGWMMRGRRENKSHSMLASENEVRAVEHELSRLEAGMGERAQRVENARSALDGLQRSLESADQERRSIEGSLAALRFEEKGLQRQKDEQTRRLEALERDRKHLLQQESEGREQEGGLLANLASLRARQSEQAGLLESFSSRLSALNQNADERSQHLSDARVQLASIEQFQKSVVLQVESLVSRKNELESTMQQRSIESEEYQQKIVEARESIGLAEKTSAEARQELTGTEARLIEERTRRAEIQGRFAHLDEAARADRRKMSDLQQVKGREEVALAEQRLHLKALVERVQRFYQVILDPVTGEEKLVNETVQPTEREQPEAPSEDGVTAVEGSEASAAIETSEAAEPDILAEQTPTLEPVPQLTIEDVEAAKREVSELRIKIDTMGPVNVEAITEFEELEQRLKFLEEQENDLTTSKQQLLEAIKKINETTLVLFKETFARIQANFSEMFQELFGGGRAELSLVNADDPLESGIEIVARPPGKQLQSISLLSGGEKTMTAVALLFAIYMVKPSPFCVLDEMDAPLDESNISRFIRILHRFVEQSQFVVITHNKRTISSADVLYGVTMEEHGVSKMVSIKLARKEESPLFPEGGDVPTIADSVRGSVAASGPESN
jgi:chromosome segregation protein